MRLIDKVIVVLFARLFSIVTKHSFINILFGVVFEHYVNPHFKGEQSETILSTFFGTKSKTLGTQHPCERGLPLNPNLTIT